MICSSSLIKPTGTGGFSCRYGGIVALVDLGNVEVTWLIDMITPRLLLSDLRALVALWFTEGQGRQGRWIEQLCIKIPNKSYSMVVMAGKKQHFSATIASKICRPGLLCFWFWLRFTPLVLHLGFIHTPDIGLSYKSVVEHEDKLPNHDSSLPRTVGALSFTGGIQAEVELPFHSHILALGFLHWTGRLTISPLPTL